MGIVKTVTNTIKNWWIPALVGAIFVLVGVTTFANPTDSFQGLALVFSLSFILVGIAEIVFAFSNREELEGWGWLLALGILTLLVGIMLTQNQNVSEQVLPFYISFLLLFRSIMGISQALDLRAQGVLDWGTVMLVSVLAMILSFIMLFNPPLASVSLVFWVGSIFILIGIVSLVIGFRLRRIKRTPQRLERKAKKAVKNVGENINNAVDDATEKASDLVEDASDAVQNAASRASDAIDDAADNLKDSIKNFGKNKGDS